MRLCVENLPEHATVQDLEDLFAPYGRVKSARILRTFDGARPGSLGYLEMLKQDAEIAISELHGRRIDFKVLRVAEATAQS